MDPRILKQRTALVLDQPFFGALALRLQVIEDPSCQTFWSDSVSLGYNPAYLATLNDQELRGVLAQVVLHVSNGHCWRMGAREPRRWDLAADYAVNAIVLGAGLTLPAGHAIDPRFAGKSVEEVYAELAQEDRRQQSPKPSPEPDSSDDIASAAVGASSTPSPGASCGEVRPYRGPASDEQEMKWVVAVHQAAKAAQMRGQLPGFLQAMASQAVAPIVDWRALLRRFVQQSAPTDYSFAVPNRRYAHMGLYLPSLQEPVLGDAVFVRDSSGSVFDETQAQFDAEILGVNDAMRPGRLIVIDCDQRVTQVQVFERGEVIELAPVRGGGGTSFVDPFRWLTAQEIQPAFLVYLTDMDGQFPEDGPAYPVLWASTTPLARARKAPFGEVIEVIC